MKRILCIVDLSESSLKVLEVASTMAYALKAYLTILFPYRLIDHGYQGDVTALKLKLEQEASEKFFRIRNQIRSMDHLTFEFQPEIGFIIDRINSFVKGDKPDMIIISQEQANTISEGNGTTLQYLISDLKSPFMIVPEESHSKV